MTAMVGLYTGYILGFSNDPLRVSAQVISASAFWGRAPSSPGTTPR